MPTANPSSSPGAFMIDEFAKAYRIGRSTVYELFDSGALRSFYVGRRRLISFEAAENWRRACEAETENSVRRRVSTEPTPTA